MSKFYRVRLSLPSGSVESFSCETLGESMGKLFSVAAYHLANYKCLHVSVESYCSECEGIGEILKPRANGKLTRIRCPECKGKNSVENLFQDIELIPSESVAIVRPTELDQTKERLAKKCQERRIFQHSHAETSERMGMSGVEAHYKMAEYYKDLAELYSSLKLEFVPV